MHNTIWLDRIIYSHIHKTHMHCVLVFFHTYMRIKLNVYTKYMFYIDNIEKGIFKRQNCILFFLLLVAAKISTFAA